MGGDPTCHACECPLPWPGRPEERAGFRLRGGDLCTPHTGRGVGGPGAEVTWQVPAPSQLPLTSGARGTAGLLGGALRAADPTRRDRKPRQRQVPVCEPSWLGSHRTAPAHVLPETLGSRPPVESAQGPQGRLPSGRVGSPVVSSPLSSPFASPLRVSLSLRLESSIRSVLEWPQTAVMSAGVGWRRAGGDHGREPLPQGTVLRTSLVVACVLTCLRVCLYACSTGWGTAGALSSPPAPRAQPG